MDLERRDDLEGTDGSKAEGNAEKSLTISRRSARRSSTTRWRARTLVEVGRLYHEHLPKDRDGEALLRVADALGGIGALQKASDASRARVAAACFSAARYDDAFRMLIPSLPDGGLEALEAADLGAFDRWVSEAALRAGEGQDKTSADVTPSLAMPRVLHRLRSVLLGMDPPKALSSAAIRWLEGVYAASGGRELFARPLADAYRAQQTNHDSAARIYRRLLARDPTNLELIEALYDVLGGETSNGSTAGARSVRALFTGADDGAASFEPMTQRPSEERLRARLLHEVSIDPIGRLLSTTALPLAAVLPDANDRPESWLAARGDGRLSDAVVSVESVTGAHFEVWLDPDGGEWATIRPGDPPRIVIGEALADDASPAELRFHLARASMLIELGYLLAERTGGNVRHRYLSLLYAVAGRDVALAPELQASKAEVLARLGAEARAQLDQLQLPEAGAGAPEVDLEPWMRSALSAADRFGLLVSGELSAALRGIRRSEPRTLGEAFATGEDRVAAVKRWRSASELVAFVLSEDFVEATRSTGTTGDLRF